MNKTRVEINDLVAQAQKNISKNICLELKYLSRIKLSPSNMFERIRDVTYSKVKWTK